MCGIFFSVSRGCFVAPSPELKKAISERGPDSLKEHQVLLEGSDHVHKYHLTFLSTVLALRGSQIQVQPLRDETSGSVFCWNGEAWKVGDRKVQGNDSSLLFESILEVARRSQDGSSSDVLNLLNSISGPFAFVFYDGLNKNLYFGRDRLGRRSLLHQTDESENFVLSSVCDPSQKGWTEVTYEGVQIIDLKNTNRSPEIHPWVKPFPPINPGLPTEPVLPLSSSSPSVVSLEDSLLSSLRLRVADIPTLGGFALEETNVTPAKVAILFSGGLDCTVLARLTHEILDSSEPIDLLNVAFENPRSVAAAKSNPNFDPYEACPDRITGRRSFLELRNACPGRPFRFVAANIPFAESQAHRSAIIGLMHPHNTEMDLSIAKALYFASRGKGTASIPQNKDEVVIMPDYTTTARVLLSGLGADELFAGYTRHATAFSRQGYSGLISELSLDITRLGQRNLGRDDRIISHWGKEARYPYLDEDLVHWALNVPVWEKCGFGTENGENNTKDEGKEEIEPAKKALRLVAQKLGLEGVAREKKRAIQFGARTAKMEAGTGRAGKTKGTDVLSP